MLTSQLFSAVDASTNQASAPFQKGDLTTFSVQFTFSGTLAGSVSLDCSNDNSNPPTHWIQVAGSPVSIAAGESAMVNVTNAGYRYVRAVWTRTSGTGTITADLAVCQPANRY